MLKGHIRAKHLYTGREIKRDVCVNIRDREITSVGKRAAGECLGEFHTVGPALIDAHSHIGMHRHGEPAAESESNDRLDSILTLTDALDSVQMDDPAFEAAVAEGVLYSCVVPGSGNILAGMSAVIRHVAADTSAALVARAGFKSATGYNTMAQSSWSGTRPTARMGAIALLRRALKDVQDKRQKRKSGRKGGKRSGSSDDDLDAGQRMLAEMLDGSLRLRVHSHKTDDIACVLRLVDEFGLNVTIEHAMDVHDPHIFRELSDRGIPVVYGPVDGFGGKTELRHKSPVNVSHLIDADGPIALMTDHPVTHAGTLLLQTRWLLRAGWSRQQAMELVTRRNAEILGIDDRLGTLEKGKWASMVAYDGDPFYLTSRPVARMLEGCMC